MPTSLDRLVRKEVSLGAIREIKPPQNHIGLGVAPFLDVATDDVIFEYIKGGLQDGLAPARAEDAEAELAQKDELFYGQGRAAVPKPSLNCCPKHMTRRRSRRTTWSPCRTWR